MKMLYLNELRALYGMKPNKKPTIEVEHCYTQASYGHWCLVAAPLLPNVREYRVENIKEQLQLGYKPIINVVQDPMQWDREYLVLPQGYHNKLLENGTIIKIPNWEGVILTKKQYEKIIDIIIRANREKGIDTVQCIL